jgi:hypothetical protein
VGEVADGGSQHARASEDRIALVSERSGRGLRTMRRSSARKRESLPYATPDGDGIVVLDVVEAATSQ